MTYLLWGLLNIAVSVIFIAFCFKATKRIREKFGLFVAIIFICGLLSFIGRSNNDGNNNEPNSNNIKTWKFVSMDSIDKNVIHLINIDVEKNLVLTHCLGIGYVKDKQGTINIPVNAYAITTGFIYGTDWKPLSIDVNRTIDNNKFEYAVDGIVEWKLLSVVIYAQPKVYKGIALVK